jgi:hypothetical protein
MNDPVHGNMVLVGDEEGEALLLNEPWKKRNHALYFSRLVASKPGKPWQRMSALTVRR